MLTSFKSMGPRMDSLYSLYDALISINVPSDRARAVVTAMERDMDTKLATKADLKHLEEMLRLEMTSLAQSLTIRMGGMIAAAVAVLATLIKLA